MTLEEFALAIEKMRMAALFGGDDVEQVGADGLDVLAEQELCAAFAFLDLAHRAAMKAHYHQVRALASSPYRY